MSKYKVLVKISGSIAAYKCCEVISQLSQKNCEIKVVVSPSVENFVGLSTLEGLSGSPVFKDCFEPSRAMDHIYLDRWADLVLLCPATSKKICELANGVGGDSISTLFLAHDFKKPYLIAPAMNPQMWSHPATKEAVVKLKSWGIQFIDPEVGEVACKESGAGRLADPSLIISRVLASLKRSKREDKSNAHEAFFEYEAFPKNKASNKPNILVVYGGTEESIDGVRTLSNFSTGRTGAFIAKSFEEKGFSVKALHSQRSPTFDLYGDETFKSYVDLEKSLQEQLTTNNYDTVVMLAAVSDFSISHLEFDHLEPVHLEPNDAEIEVKKIDPGKIEAEKVSVNDQTKLSSDRPPKIVLKKNEKIISKIKGWSKNKNVSVIGFKLTKDASMEQIGEAVRKMLTNSNSSIDFVVQNDLSQIDSRNHHFKIFDSSAREIESGSSKSQMSAKLRKLILSEFRKTAKSYVPSSRVSTNDIRAVDLFGQGSEAKQSSLQTIQPNGESLL